jgi:hypothetical protein
MLNKGFVPTRATHGQLVVSYLQEIIYISNIAPYTRLSVVDIAHRVKKLYLWTIAYATLLQTRLRLRAFINRIAYQPNEVARRLGAKRTEFIIRESSVIKRA